MTAVLAFHQAVEGIGMGSVLQEVVSHNPKALTFAKLCSFVAIFSLTISCGVVIGYNLTPTPTDDANNNNASTNLQNGIEGVFTSLAAGSMLFVALSELVGNYFHKPAFQNQPVVKLTMLAMFGLGIAVMAIIGIWA